MLKRLHYIATIYFLLLGYGSMAQSIGFPFITNYMPTEISYDSQVWCSLQDKRGVMYFGVTGGVMEYDGVGWRLIPISEITTTRSMDIDPTGTIYIGAVGEIGYLEPNKQGLLEFHSLTELVPAAHRFFADVWNTVATADGVYFNVNDVILWFHWVNGQHKVDVITYDAQTFFINRCHDRLLFSTVADGLWEMRKGKMVQLLPQDKEKSNSPWGILPYSDSWVTFVNLSEEPFKLVNLAAQDSNIQSKEFPYQTPEEKVKTIRAVNDGNLYHVTMDQDSTYLIATINSGYFQIARTGTVLQNIDQHSGLDNNTVHHVFPSPDGGVWASMSFGMAYVEQNSPLKLIGMNNGLKGVVYDTRKFESHMYVATSIGAFYSDNGQFKFVDGLSEKEGYQVFEFFSYTLPNETTARLFATSPYGLFEIQNNKARKISDTSCSKFIQSSNSPRQFFLDDGYEIARITYENGRWSQMDTIASLNGQPTGMAIDKENRLWFLLDQNLGNTRIDKKKQTQVFKYGGANGFPKMNNISKLNNKLVFCSQKGIYEYDTKIRPLTEAWAKPYKNKNIFEINQADAHTIVILFKQGNSKYVDIVKFQGKGFEIDSTTLRRIKNLNYINADDSLEYHLIAEKEVVTYTPGYAKHTASKPNLLLRRVSLANDSVLFFGSIPLYQGLTTLVGNDNSLLEAPTLDYNNRSLRFEYALCAYAASNRNMYRVALSFDGEPTQWSAWSTETFKEFSNLSEGSYQLQIQGKDVYDKLSEPISYKFTILAPWYRTWYAFAAYFIVFNLVVWLIIRLNTRRIRLDKIKLESIVVERTAEVNKQKEELSAQADFLIKANDKLHSQNIKIEKQQAELRSQTEILQETNIQLTDKNEEILLQKEEIIATAETLKTANEQITEQNRLITDSIRYARRIQDAVLPHKKALAAFFAESVIFYQPRNIVSGDFYWIKSVGNKVLIALADCTGHGVPGAFMSMLSIAMLNEIVRKKDIDNCAAVLEELRIQIKSSLHQTGKEKEPKDGLDICLVSYDIGNRQIEYSGANMPLYLVRNAEIIEYKPVRNPIGIYWVERPFVNTQIQLEIGDFLYMTSDGYLDQFGRQNAEKFRVARFRSLITELASKSGSEQEQILADTIQNWMLPNNKQIDDILVLGFQI